MPASQPAWLVATVSKIKTFLSTLLSFQGWNILQYTNKIQRQTFIAPRLELIYLCTSKSCSCTHVHKFEHEHDKSLINSYCSSAITSDFAMFGE